MGIKASVRYLESDVLTEAKARIKHVIDIFDHVYVAFSGGKDSLVTLHLVRECYREMGIVGPVRCLFRDEELIPSQVIDFVQAHWRDTENWSMDYYAVPLKSSKFILGQTYDYIQWDPAREWIRPKPASAITEIPGWENRVFSQYDMDAAAFSHLKGKVAIITGIRADESMTRFKAIVNKRHESHICSPDSAHPSNANLVRPIYDWSQNDIFKYLHDREIKYCDIYDSQVWNKENLRVSTPLHAESSKRIYKLRTRDPIFYEQLIALFPEMLMQERYWDEMDRGAIFEKYPPCFDGILQYIEENIEDAWQAPPVWRPHCFRLWIAGCQEGGACQAKGYRGIHHQEERRSEFT